MVEATKSPRLFWSCSVFARKSHQAVQIENTQPLFKTPLLDRLEPARSPRPRSRLQLDQQHCSYLRQSIARRATTPIISKVLPLATPTQAGSLCYTNTLAWQRWARGTPLRKHWTEWHEDEEILGTVFAPEGLQDSTQGSRDHSALLWPISLLPNVLRYCAAWLPVMQSTNQKVPAKYPAMTSLK